MLMPLRFRKCALLATALVSYAISTPVPNHQKRLDATYDYVIVGGGTAGLTLAARLSEDSSTRVAVIEAGSLYEITNPLLSSTPAGDVIFAGASPLDTNPLVDWNFLTTPQAGANDRVVHYPRGKCLGGR
jgi:choline dehydrogenase